ncbi:MAG: hypothetical protein WCS43_15255 [Verrucomicrobiota bacterium]
MKLYAFHRTPPSPATAWPDLGATSDETMIARRILAVCIGVMCLCPIACDRKKQATSAEAGSNPPTHPVTTNNEQAAPPVEIKMLSEQERQDLGDKLRQMRMATDMSEQTERPSHWYELEAQLNRATAEHDVTTRIELGEMRSKAQKLEYELTTADPNFIAAARKFFKEKIELQMLEGSMNGDEWRDGGDPSKDDDS